MTKVNGQLKILNLCCFIISTYKTGAIEVTLFLAFVFTSKDSLFKNGKSHKQAQHETLIRSFVASVEKQLKADTFIPCFNFGNIMKHNKADVMEF